MTWLHSIQVTVDSKYQAFVDALEDDLLVGELVLLYSWPSVVERNETHEIDLHLPNHISIGNDSGDYEFLIRRDGCSSVYRCDAGSFGTSKPELIATDFTQWVNDGCPPPKTTQRTLPLHGPIWLIRPPDNGLKGMLELRKVLGQSWPASSLKDMMANVPFMLVKNGFPFATYRQLETQPEYLACLGCGHTSQELVTLKTQQVMSIG